MKVRALLAAALVLPVLPLVASAGSAVADSSVPTVLLQTSDGHWWSEPITGGTPTLTAIKGSGLLSPDGTLFAQASSQSDKPSLAIAPADGSAAHVLLDANQPAIGLLRWDATSTRVLALGYQGKQAVLEWIDAHDGTITIVRKVASGVAQDIGPDLRMGIDAYIADGQVRFVDAQNGLSAGSIVDADNTGSFDPDVEDPVLSAGGIATWSPAGDRALVVTTQDDSSNGYYTASTTLSLINLGTRTITTAAGGSTITPTFSADGHVLCWTDDSTSGYDPETEKPYNDAFCATTSLDHATKLTLPSPGPVDGIAIVGTAAPVLDASHGTITNVRATTRPSAIEVKESVKGGDGAGQLVVLTRGKHPAANPESGFRGQVTEAGHVVFSQLPPRQTFTVTVFPRSWAGIYGSARSSTLTTPKLPASTTRVTVTRGRTRTAIVTVRRAYDGHVLAGAHVTLSGQANPNADLGYAPSGPFRVFAHLVTDAHGRAQITVPAKVAAVRATSAAATGWSGSTSTIAYL